MRIGIDASRAFVDKPTGTERYAFEVITRMLRLKEAKEVEWILYTRGTTSPITPLLTSGEGNLRVVNIPFGYLWTQVGLAARTWVDKLDVLWVPAHTLPILRKPGIKTVVTIHGIEYEWLPAYENLLQRWYLPLSTVYAVKSATKVIAVSGFTKGQLVERLGADEEKIKVIEEGFDLTPTPLSSLQERGINRDVLKKFNLVSKKYILFVGTVQPRKNLVRLIEAFSRLKDKNYKLVICGKLGWNYQDVLLAPEKYGVVGRVVITEYVDDETRQILLENAEVYTQPSITEGFGLPILEAFAAGVPVASSYGGALSEVVGEAGLMYNPEKVDEISASLDKLLGDAKLQKKLVKMGHERVGEFGWDKAASATYSLMRSW